MKRGCIYRSQSRDVRRLVNQCSRKKRTGRKNEREREKSLVGYLFASEKREEQGMKEMSSGFKSAREREKVVLSFYGKENGRWQAFPVFS